MEEFIWTNNILSIILLVNKKFEITYANKTALKEFDWDNFEGKSIFFSLMNKSQELLHKNLDMDKQQTNRMNI